MSLKHFATATFLLLILMSAGFAKDNYVWTAEEQEVVKPKAVFDSSATAAQMEPGTNTLTGTGYTRGNAQSGRGKEDKRPLGPGTKVYLFPYTPYCEEVVGMLNKHKVRQPEMSQATISARRELEAMGKEYPVLLPRKRVEFDPDWPNFVRSTTVVDDKGTFVFDNLKPGKYFVQTQPLSVERLVEYGENVGSIETTTTNIRTGQVDVDSQSVVVSGYADMNRTTTLEQVVDVGAQGHQTFELSTEAPAGK